MKFPSLNAPQTAEKIKSNLRREGRKGALAALGCFCFAFFAAPATAADKAGSIQFVEATKQAGVNFVHSFGDANFSNLAESNGSGVAWLDYDNDGWIDVYLGTGKFNKDISQGDKPKPAPLNRLYRNKGNGTFEDVTKKAGVACEGCYTMGLSAADYDNDGFTDIFVANFGKNRLFRNRGDGTFEDKTDAAGVGGADWDCTIAAVWLDYNRDGKLDLFQANYIEFDPKYNLFYAPDGFPGPMAYDGQRDRLFRNAGGGKFEEASNAAGIVKKGRAMSVAAADVNGDGFDDIYVTNDMQENFFYQNQGGKKFEDMAGMYGLAFNGMADQTASMAVDFGDHNGDGNLDIWVTDNALCSLYENDGSLFQDVSFQAGIARTSAQFEGWGSFFFDYDNDGDLDIFKANSDLSRLFGQEDQIYENIGPGGYADVSGQMGPYFHKDTMGRGAAFADYDNDGDPDILILNINGPAVLLRNDGGNRNNMLSIKLVGKKGNSDGIGAKVKVVTGKLTQTAEKRSSGGYLSQNDPRLLFGLGKSKSAGRVEIVWPSGKKQTLKDVPAGKTITIEEPSK